MVFDYWFYLKYNIELFSNSSVVNSVSINNDILSIVGIALVALGMRWGWLVNGPIVLWRILSWVLDLCKLRNLFLFVLNLVVANEDLVSEHFTSHGVCHEGWVNKDWNTLRLGKICSILSSVLGCILSNYLSCVLGCILCEVEDLCGVLRCILSNKLSCILCCVLAELCGILWSVLVKKNLVVSNGNLEVEFLLSNFILLENWVHKDWLTLLLSDWKWFGDWRWLVGNQILEVAFGDVLVVENVIYVIWVLLLHLEESLGCVWSNDLRCVLGYVLS